MRAELPWNVAGIPPEAREAARAAARREGLSVGEWLTRRILRSFSGMEDELAPMPYENRAPTGAPLDSWGLPPSAASRRDTEEMMARVGRSENESNDAWRRIEDQLRGLSRRLDSSERSHGESNRVISRTAQEINIASREQAQAFDQMGLNVIALNERLERLERSAAHDGIKDAVKALHQGLSRLADQITATANNSATQVLTLTSNLEQLASRVGQSRVDSEEADRALDGRIDASERAVGARLEAIDHALDTRLSSVEKTAQFNTNALDHALEKIEASANQRATDQVENQKRAAQHEETLLRLEDSIARLEMRLPDAEFERRLDGIERSVSGMAERLEKHDPAEKFDASMQAMSYRLDALENNHNDLLNEMRNKMLRPVEPPPYEAPRAQAMSQPAPQPMPQSAFEPPPYAEPPPVMDAMPEPAPFPGYADEATDAFAPTTPHGFAFDIPAETPADPFAAAPEFADVFADAPEPENFLAQARRSARAASEKAESESRGRFAAFRWSKDAAEGEEKAKPRYLLPALVAMLVVVAAAAALILSQHAKQPDMAAAPVTRPATTPGPTYSVPSPPDSDDTQFVVAPQAGAQPQGDEKNYNTQRSEPDSQDTPPRTAMPLKQRDVRNAPVNPVSDGAKANAPAPSADKVMQLANAGNPIALTILGLRALDGTPANLPDAVKFLSQAAEKGQAVAQYRLGTLYERGQGVAADPAKAAHWYEMAANQGNRKAMHNLAVSYASGANGGKKNMAEAARWFAKAAALGLSDSQFNLAVLYERGDGVPQSLLDAFKWYSIAATAGDSESKQRMNVLQTQLSDSDKAAANKSAATFHAAPLNRSANVPPEAADLGI
jgi:localization factor PodJL